MEANAPQAVQTELALQQGVALCALQGLQELSLVLKQDPLLTGVAAVEALEVRAAEDKQVVQEVDIVLV